MTEKLFSGNDETYEPSASDLREEYLIADFAEYVVKFRKSFLKWARESKGLTKGKVCKACHISQSDLKRIEDGGVTERDLKHLSDLAEIYGISYQYTLALFKLVKRPVDSSQLKIAAYHPAQIDEKTKTQISKFIMKLKNDKG